MSDYRVKETDLTALANAIRTKGGTGASLSFPDGFVSAVQNIPTGGGSTLIAKNVTENGTYYASSDNADGYSSVTVAVPLLFEYVYTYTVPESWESGQTGGTMARAVLSDHYVNDSAAYYMVFRNNGNTSGYRADAICVSHTASPTDNIGSGWVYRNYYNSAETLGSVARATQGTLIDLYVAKYPS